jgi:hypothetical protein
MSKKIGLVFAFILLAEPAFAQGTGAFAGFPGLDTPSYSRSGRPPLRAQPAMPNTYTTLPAQPPTNPYTTQFGSMPPPSAYGTTYSNTIGSTTYGSTPYGR